MKWPTTVSAFGSVWTLAWQTRGNEHNRAGYECPTTSPDPLATLVITEDVAAQSFTAALSGEWQNTIDQAVEDLAVALELTCL